MQACPYDALYIDPETHTAAKCNYCAHRVDIGLEPACVNVCPEHAIISGDMHNPNSEISELLARQAVKTRKPEKGTAPNLFYIDADDVSLIPGATETTDSSLWGSQSLGVGHFAKEAEKMSFSNSDVVTAVMNLNAKEEIENAHAPKSVEVLMNKKAKRVYDTPDKGILWGWEVSGYVWTKAISAGVFMITFIAWMLKFIEWGSPVLWWGIGLGLVFLILTGLLLVLDLDKPGRFVYVLLRPHWESWLVKGGYAITLYGGLLTLIGASMYFGWDQLFVPLMYTTGVFSIIVAIYTAFLFAQAKGRDFWQSPTLSLHMLIHAVMAGSGTFLIVNVFSFYNDHWSSFLSILLVIGIALNLFTMIIELGTTHPTKDAKLVVNMIVKGRYKKWFWFGAIIIGNIIPLLTLILSNGSVTLLGLAALLSLIGIYITERIWVEAPQRISLI